jgi:excisionase family DNA binding protein
MDCGMKETKDLVQGKYEGKLRTVSEAAKYLRMGESTLYYKVSKGIIPPCPQPHSKMLFHIDCLDAYLDGKDVRRWWPID